MLASTFLLLLNGAFFTLRLGSAGSFPRPLSSREENDLVRRWLEGDIESRNKLIEHNLRLVAHIIKKYYIPDRDQEDLISIGTIGLIKGISTYRPDKGVRLAPYASRCIENELLMFFRSTRKSQGDVSLSESIDNDADGSSLMLMDILTDEADMTETVASRELCSHLDQFIDQCLDPREAEIIRLRYGLRDEEPLTQRETAAKCAISRSYVSRLEKRALNKLRKMMEEE